MEEKMSDNYEPIDLEAGNDTGQFIEEEGLYTVAIVKTSMQYSRDGKPGYKFQMKTQEGKMIYDTFWLSIPARWRLRRLGKVCGLTEAEMKAFVPNMLIGKTLDIVTEADPNFPLYQKIIDIRKASKEIDIDQIPEPENQDTVTSTNQEHVPF